MAHCDSEAFGVLGAFVWFFFLLLFGRFKSSVCVRYARESKSNVSIINKCHHLNRKNCNSDQMKISTSLSLGAREVSGRDREGDEWKTNKSMYWNLRIDLSTNKWNSFQFTINITHTSTWLVPTDCANTQRFISLHNVLSSNAIPI